MYEVIWFQLHDTPSLIWQHLFEEQIDAFELRCATFDSVPHYTNSPNMSNT